MASLPEFRILEHTKPYFSKIELGRRVTDDQSAAMDDMFGAPEIVKRGRPKAPKNPNLMLESLSALVFMRDDYKAVYQHIHGSLQPGPERKFSLCIYDTRTATVEIYALRETGTPIGWKERLKRLAPDKAPERTQNNFRIVVHQLITADTIVAGMRLRNALDFVEHAGYLPEGLKLDFSDLEMVLEGMEIDAHQVYEA